MAYDGLFLPADLNHDGKLDANEWLLLLQLQQGMLPALIRWSNVPYRNELVKQLRLAMKKSAERRQRALWHGALVEEGAVSGATFDLGVGDGDGDDLGDDDEEQAGQGGRSRSRTRRNHRPKSAPAEQQLAAEQQVAEMGKRRPRRRRKARHKTQGGNDVLQFY